MKFLKLFACKGTFWKAKFYSNGHDILRMLGYQD